MKTITPKNAFKLCLLMLILFSAKAISHPRLPNDSGSSDCGSRIGTVKKATTVQTKTSKVSLKVAISK